MEKQFNKGDRVKFKTPYPDTSVPDRVLVGDTGEVEGFYGDLIRVRLDKDGTVENVLPYRLEVLKAVQVTLHGRPVKLGDRLYYLPSRRFVLVADLYPDQPWISLSSIAENQQDLAWDEPPKVDVSKIEPPLFFCEGYPVRKGSIMFDKAREVAVVIAGNEYYQYVDVQYPQTGNVRRVEKAHLSYGFPNTPPAPPKVLQKRTRWFNIYEEDAVNGRKSFLTYSSEAEAKKYANPGCLGQGYFTYQFVGPEKGKAA